LKVVDDGCWLRFNNGGCAMMKGREEISSFEIIEENIYFVGSH